jgi:NTP pyrophosphatase (non-canonical NTP hydrolase)
MNLSPKEIYELAVKKYGHDAQIGQLHEEIGELMQAINKYNRNPSLITHSNVSEEIADVEIMLEQLKVIFQNHSNVIEIKAAKLVRLWERISKP